MSDEKILTIKEIAKQLMAEQIELGFWGYTQLDGAAAEILSMHEGYIYLHHLTEISDAAAESLSRGGESLSLDGQTSLSDVAAESLGKHEGTLHLNGLEDLSDDIALRLSQAKLSASPKIKRQIKKAVSTRNQQARDVAGRPAPSRAAGFNAGGTGWRIRQNTRDPERRSTRRSRPLASMLFCNDGRCRHSERNGLWRIRQTCWLRQNKSCRT